MCSKCRNFKYDAKTFLFTCFMIRSGHNTSTVTMIKLGCFINDLYWVIFIRLYLIDDFIILLYLFLNILVYKMCYINKSALKRKLILSINHNLPDSWYLTSGSDLQVTQLETWLEETTMGKTTERVGLVSWSVIRSCCWCCFFTIYKTCK